MMNRKTTVPCIFLADAEESMGDGDNGQFPASRPRYDLEMAIDLPFVPSTKRRFCGLFPKGTRLVVLDLDEDDDDSLGLPPILVVYDLERRAFVVRFGVIVLLPWESVIETVQTAVPGWTVRYSEERSERRISEP